jgi:tRNA (mo5U34)-methyltransferase
MAMDVLLTLDERRRLVQTRRDWFHSIDFGEGIVSPGTCPPDYQSFLWKTFRLPDDMRGLRVLDIGTYDGFFAFECERRGADVVAIDVHPEDLRCFKLARQILGSRVQYHHLSAYDLGASPLASAEPFDIVLFLGVYYHLRHMFIALDNIWKVTRGFMIMETHVIDDCLILGDGTTTTLKDVDRRLIDTPIYRFYRLNELNPVDYSNWFGGNIAAVSESLRSTGFTPTLLGTWNNRAAFKAAKNPATPREWEIGSYEGTHFTYNPDGTWSCVWHDPSTTRPETK